MPDADHGRFRDRRVADRKIFQLDGRDPLTARLDDVLGAVGNLHVSMTIDGRDVARIEETVLVEDDLVLFVVGASDGRPTRLEPADGLAVTRKLAGGVVGDLHFDSEWGMALFHLDVEPLLGLESGIFRLERADGAERAHLGHPPGMANLDP